MRALVKSCAVLGRQGSLGSRMFILSVSTPSKLGNSAALRGAAAGRVGVKVAFWRGGSGFMPLSAMRAPV